MRMLDSMVLPGSCYVWGRFDLLFNKAEQWWATTLFTTLHRYCPCFV